MNEVRAYRELLKQALFNSDSSKIPVRKEIIVETNYGHVEIVRDGPDGYSSFKTNQGDNALQYAKDKMSKGFDGIKDLSKYELIIK